MESSGSSRSGKLKSNLRHQALTANLSFLPQGGFMDFARGSDSERDQQYGRSSSSFANPTPPTGGGDQPTAPQANNPQFDIFEWYPKYQSCHRYFITHAQQSPPVLAVAAFINIALPFQRPVPISPPSMPHSPTHLHPTPAQQSPPAAVSLVPYLRRLVVTGLDFPGVLHGFFGDDWATGVGPLHEQERRNYLFAAKSGGWASVKRDYDMLPMETVPFMRPLQGPVIAEIEAAEKSWSAWLAMEDWMVGPRAPENIHGDSRAGGNGEPARTRGER